MAIVYEAVPNKAPLLEALPEEIITLILSQSSIDIKALRTCMSVSSKLRRISLYILEYYRLPATQLSLTIDQEGKSKMTTRFGFSHFCPVSLTTLYTSYQPMARRYYTDKAYPVVRSMAIDYASCDIQSSSVSIASSTSGTLVGSCSSSSSSSSISVAKQPCYTNTPSDLASVYYHGNAKKLSAQKEGLHILQVSPHLANQRLSWKLAYRITDKRKPEYYMSLISISIGFKHLMKLDALNQGVDVNATTRKLPLKSMNKMKNWVNRLV
ncbi:uncharacterized protein ATC70_004198 [Mucor velutinosus]|uniref:F-box domain-containing protein n=1 Tax=Mucor velutinosus TaxID=708070 RepID=A0AAN7DTF2_9FUNG|nr:hypothetical protein ATC70_000003 [Mucor velutinosus]KAK4521666.1 hypothetical protein ATC70_004198 [Mucor velutinosus]